MSDDYEKYYVPEQSYWPIIGAISLTIFVVGLTGLIKNANYGFYCFLLGTGLLVYMIVGWFGHVIQESLSGLYSQQMDTSFRLGMVWFIFSEVMFFAAFFGALFYARILSVPWLGGIGEKASTHEFLWPDFQATWPLLITPDPERFPAALGVISWQLPALNTALLMLSGLTLTFAHHALLDNKHTHLLRWLLATILLGVVFLGVQSFEYYHAYYDLGIKLSTGIYGSTFFLLTGFHGLHVFIGSIMLLTIYMRCQRHHFTAEKHFAFEAAAWYWHFVDVVWILLFIFVYLL